MNSTRCSSPPDTIHEPREKKGTKKTNQPVEKNRRKKREKMDDQRKERESETTRPEIKSP